MVWLGDQVAVPRYPLPPAGGVPVKQAGQAPSPFPLAAMRSRASAGERGQG